MEHDFSARISPFEAEVMRWMLAGGAPVLECLRRQFEESTITSRQLSGVGFFLNFAVSDSAPRWGQPANFEVGDVHATVKGVDHGVGLLLFIRDGVLSWLEGYTYGEPWPESIGEFTLRYEVPRGSSDVNTLGIMESRER